MSIAPGFTWLLEAAISCLAFELILRLPIVQPARAIMELAGKSRRVLTSRRISEHWKERVSQAYSLRMGRSTLWLALWIAVFVCAVAVLIMSAELLQPGVRSLATSLPGMVFALCVSLIYFGMRQYRAR